MHKGVLTAKLAGAMHARDAYLDLHGSEAIETSKSTLKL